MAGEEPVASFEFGDLKQCVTTHLRASGYPADDCAWSALSGGRTNRVWRFGNEHTTLVCKLYDGTGASPLFPNDPVAEAETLRQLSETGLAPTLISDFVCDQGHVVLYAYIDGQTWQPDQTDFAGTLRTLHRTPASPDQRKAPTNTQAILKQADDILSMCGSPRTEELRRCRPTKEAQARVTGSLIHGDLVPQNVVQSGTSYRLIDWQCPASAAPCEDIATLFSPAMSHLYGSSQPTASQLSGFLANYGDTAVSEDLTRLRPAFHYRIAAHCLWKFERGHADYRRAFDLEFAALKSGGTPG